MEQIYSEIERLLLKQGKFYISLELDRIKKVLNKLNNPQDNLKIIHVAGTNGKGSTCRVLSKILEDEGYKVGIYTSPHLLKYNERISINNKKISDKKLLELIKKISKIANDVNVKLTEFEILTAVMYQYFYEEKVDFAVVEVGLGGRFDATNCILNPLLSIITSISFDHTDRLGDSIEKIAYEKAGIIKENCPVVFSKNNMGTKVLKQASLNKNSKIYYPDKSEIIFKNKKNILKYNNKIYECNLLGKFQSENLALALCAVNVLKENNIKIREIAIIKALKEVKWEGRFEYIKDKNIIIDGCHNPDGARVLRESLDYYFPEYKRTFVFTSLKNKDYLKVQKNLFREEDNIYHYETNSDRFVSKKKIRNCIKSIDINELKSMIKQYREKELIIICGSLYAIGDILGRI